MENKFTKCETLMDVYEVFMVDPDNAVLGCLSVDEQIKLLCICNEIRKAEGKKPYEFTQFRRNFESFVDMVVETGARMEEAAEAAREYTSGGNAKTKMGLFDVVKSAWNSIMGIAKNIKVKAGQTKEDFIEDCDENMEEVKKAFEKACQALGNVTGLNTFIDAFYAAFYRETKGVTTRRGFQKAAKRLIKFTQEYIDEIIELDPDSGLTLQQVTALKYFIEGDEEGNPTGRRSIITATLNGLAWICKKVVKKLKDWGIYEPNAEKNIFGACGAAISSVFGVACGIIKSAVSLVINCVIYAGAYVLSLLVNVFLCVIEKLKGWAKAALDFITKTEINSESEIDEDDIFEEEIA